MPAIAALTLNDAEATPVAHTFSPDSIQDGVARWVDRSGGISLGFPVLSMSLRPPTKTSRTYKLMIKVTVPTLEVTSPSTSSGIQPAPTLAYNDLGTLEMVFHERSTKQQRKNLFAYMLGGMNNVTFTKAAVEEYERVFGA